jgi:hypothetical protein
VQFSLSSADGAERYDVVAWPAEPLGGKPIAPAPDGDTAWVYKVVVRQFPDTETVVVWGRGDDATVQTRVHGAAMSKARDIIRVGEFRRRCEGPVRFGLHCAD